MTSRNTASYRTAHQGMPVVGAQQTRAGLARTTASETGTMQVEGTILAHWRRAALAGLVAVLAMSVPAAPKDKDEFDWQEAAREIDNLPFVTAYIDSVRKEHNVAPHIGPLRRVPRASFCSGEKLVYEVAWGPFKAGYVVMEVTPDKSNGTIRLGAKALSNSFVDAFYRMRDYVISTVDAEGLYPIFFEQHLREGKKYKADGYILYDHTEGKLHVQSRKKLKTVETAPFVHDYLSVLYYVRALQMAPRDTFTLSLFIHSKVHPIRIRCVDRKPMQLGSRTVNCIKVEPRLMGEGRAFNKKDKLEVWLTDDEHRTPVLIKSKLSFGAVSARLVWQSPSSS